MGVKFLILNVPGDIEKFRAKVESMLPMSCKFSFQNRSSNAIAYFILEDVEKRSASELLNMVDAAVLRSFGDLPIIPNFG